MAIETSIGKNTLGGGNKMNVYMHEYNRSTHDLSYTWRNTQSVGTLVPFMCEVALPGDTWYIKLRTQMLTHPTIGPLFGSFKQQNDIFLCPIRLYNALLHNNSLNIGLNMSQVKLPQIKIKSKKQQDQEYLEGTRRTILKQINPSCLLSYLGIKGILGEESIELDTYQKNATALVTYFDIFKNYYANKQESKFFTIGIESGYIQFNDEDNYDQGWCVGTVNLNGNNPIITTGSKTVLGNGTTTNMGAICLGSTEISNINDIQISFYDNNAGQYRTGYLSSWFDTADPSPLDQKSFYRAKDVTANWTIEKVIRAGSTNLQSWPLQQIDDVREEILSMGRNQYIIAQTSAPNYLQQFAMRDNNNEYLRTSYPQFGLALKTYQSDIFTNWVKTEWIDGDNGVNAITAIDTSSGSFSLDTLNLSQKVYDMLNRIAVSDGSYHAWIRTVYTSGGVPHYETPVYMGGSSSEIEFEEVVSNAATVDQPLGSLAGRGRNTRAKGGEIKIKVDEPCYILGITSITPRVDYYQGNRFDTNFRTLNDLHKPALDGIGFQDRLYKTLDAQHYDTPQLTKSIGKQPAWIDYMTNFNRTYGNFAILENEGWMCLNRVFTNLANYTTYINPKEYNGIFADTDLDAMNFWSQIHVDAKVRRVMSAKQIPNL